MAKVFIEMKGVEEVIEVMVEDERLENFLLLQEYNNMIENMRVEKQK